MRVRDSKHPSKFGAPLLAFWICGVVGVLIDLDHPIGYIFGLDGQSYHTPLLYIASVVLCGISAYLGGLFIWMVLSRRGK
jgi:hypothetical protein